MKNGFYFNSNIVSADFFLLQKLGLIEAHEKAHEKAQDDQQNQPFFYLNEEIFSFSSVFEYRTSSDLIVVFNDMSSEQLAEIKEKISKNQKQKVLFIAHILFDYQSVLQALIKALGIDRILVLVDNHKHPYIVSEADINIAGNGAIRPEHILIYKKKSTPVKSKTAPILVVFFRYVVYFILKLILKPKQFLFDFYATYNPTYVFGRMKVIVIKLYFLLRHVSVMSFIRFFYGLKVIAIRVFYWVIEKVKTYPVSIYYWIRHVSVMSFIRLFYGLKVIAIRSLYLLRHFMVILILKSYFESKDFFCRMILPLPIRAYYFGIALYQRTHNLIVNLFYGLKTFLIRSYYWIIEKTKLGTIFIFYRTRHILVMLFIRIYYGLKVIFIRIYYWIHEKIKFVSLKLYYGSCHVLLKSIHRIQHFFVLTWVTIKVFIVYKMSHFFVMSRIYIQSFLSYLSGFLIWLYYRFIWTFHKAYEINLKYTFYPIRKIYWFCHFQYEKRIQRRKI